MLKTFEAVYEKKFSQEWKAAAHDDISLAEVRQALSSILGSLFVTAIASREQR